MISLIKNNKDYILYLILGSGLIYLSFFYFLSYRDIANMYRTMEYISYITFIIGFGLSYFFNSSKVFFILLIMGFLQIIDSQWVTQYIFRDINFKIYNKIIINAIYIFIPINLIFFSFFRERGILSFWGFSKLIVILGQGLGLCIALNKNLKHVSTNNSLTLISWNFLNLANMDYHRYLMLFYFFVVFLILIIKEKNAANNSFVLLLIALIISLNFVNDYGLNILPLLFIISAIILIFAIIKSAYILAYKDELTGLASRRALDGELLKQGKNYSIAMLDIDFFKKFNDKYGHDIGDQVLQMIAVHIKETGGGAKVFRYGGEEFTLLFPGKTVDECIEHLEDLRKRIAERPFYIRGENRPQEKPQLQKEYNKSGSTKKEQITVSIGVATKTKELKKPEEVIKAADKALYRAKNKGRNQVCRQ